MWLYVTGILKPDVLGPESTPPCWSATPSPGSYLGFDGHPTTIYVKAADSQVNRVHNLLAATAYPEDPTAVERLPALLRPGRPSRRQGRLQLPVPRAWARSPCWSAPSASPTSWSSPCWNAAARSGCAARWARPRATSAPQFLAEATLLARSAASPGCGRAIATAIYAHAKGWATLIPTEAWAGGIGATIAIGALAGLLPALRAARLPPTEALWSI